MARRRVTIKRNPTSPSRLSSSRIVTNKTLENNENDKGDDGDVNSPTFSEEGNKQWV